MKKRKILYLFPLVGFLLTGCTLQEGWKSTTDWFSKYLIEPVKNLFHKGESKKEEQPSGGGDVKPDATVKSIMVKSYKEQVVQNYSYKTTDVVLTVYLSDGTNVEKNPESVKCDTSAIGETTLTVTYKGHQKEVSVEVISESDIVHVESIRWSVASQTLHVGETEQITVTVEPENATDPSLTFVSSDTSVLTVSSDGLVKGIAVGSATVTITPNDAPDLGKKVSFTVNEEAVALPEATAAGYQRLAAGETLLTGEKINVAGAIGSKYYVMQQYSSGNNIKAKEVQLENEQLVITEADEFTVIDNGDGTIALMQDNGKYLSACGDDEGKNYLKVTDNIDKTAKFSYSVDANGNAQLQAKGVNRGYLCLNPNTQYGQPLFSCYRSADYEKYAIYHDGNGSTEHVDVEGVSFADEEVSVEVGSTVDVLATVSPALASDKQVIYEIQSADPEGCVTLSGNTVTAVAVGEAVIIAKSHENEEISDTIAVHVVEHIERNYGTLENPLSINEAKKVIDLDGGKAAETMYVTGKVSKNDAYNSQYKNTNVWLTDGVNEFELYAALLPEGFEPAQPAKDDPALVGKKVIAHGSGKIYNNTYEFDKNCQIDSVTDEEIPVITVTGLIEGSATGIPETIEQGESLDRTDISVGVYMSDGSEGVTHPDSIVLDTENLGLVGGKLIVGEFEYEFTITVVEKVEKNYGTLENPLSVSEALAIITEECPSSGNVTKEQIYCEGEVTAVGEEKNYGFNNVKVSDGQSEVLIYSLNMTAEQKADFGVGKTIKFHGYAKNYNGTLEFASKGSDYVTVDEVIVEVVPVTGISLDKDSLDIEVGMPDKTLVATVLPENATNKAVEWESANAEVATVNDGTVHAVAVGETTVTVTSVADPTISATCTVTVSEQTKEVVSVQIKTMPQVEYNEGDLLDLSDLVLTLYYDDQSTEDVTTGYTTNIALDHELTTEDTELIITYGEFGLQPITLTITAKPQPTHAGTAEDPYTIKDCEIVYANAKLDQGQDIGAEVYVAGTILADPAATISGGRGRLYIGDSSSQNSLYIYNINNIGGSNNLTLADIPAGSEVVAKGTLKNYNGMQLCYVSSVANCEFISIEKPFIAPATVEITSGSELGVGSNMNLAATVGPEGAAQDVEWTIVNGVDYATLSDGVLTGVAAGDVTVRATAVGYENVYAEKTITVSSSVVPTEQVVYTLDGTVTATGNAYATATVLTQGGVEWSVTGNTEMNPWRIGGKGLTNVDRPVSSNGTVSAENISKVAVDIGATGSSLTLNSVTLNVGSTAGGSNISTQTVTANITNNVVEFERPSNANWASAYFTVVFNVTRTGTSGNGYVLLNAITFYAVI